MEEVATWGEQAIQWLVALVEHLGIGGIFIMTFLESTFAPIPSEITMIPAGYLVQQGQMSLPAVFIASVLGTVGGAYFNFLIARRYGRKLFLRYGKYFLMTPEKLEKLELFFASHGSISMFTGRLIPGIRHYISFPAGLAKMDTKKFLTYTALGGALWMSVLLAVGYYIGKNQELAMQYMPRIKLGILVVIVVLVVGYLIRHKVKARKAAKSPDGK